MHIPLHMSICTLMYLLGVFRCKWGGGFLLIIIKVRLSNLFTGKKGSSMCKWLWLQVRRHAHFLRFASRRIQNLLLPRGAKPAMYAGCSPTFTSSYLTVSFWLVGKKQQQKKDSLTFTNSHQFYWKLLKTFKNLSSEGMRLCHNECTDHFFQVALLQARLKAEL